MNSDQICALLAIRDLSARLVCKLRDTIAREAMPQEHIEGVDEAKRRCEKRYGFKKFELGRPYKTPTRK